MTVAIAPVPVQGGREVEPVDSLPRRGARATIREVRPALFIILGIALSSLACAKDELELHNRLDSTLSLEIHAPDDRLIGGCSEPFATRFCLEEYVPLGIIDIAPLEDRIITISDAVTDERCTNLLWLRLVRLAEVGPVEDPGTLLQLPTAVEIEAGAGALHAVAFPNATVRIDEIGAPDPNQSKPPQSCESLGRDPRI